MDALIVARTLRVRNVAHGVCGLLLVAASLLWPGLTIAQQPERPVLGLPEFFPDPPIGQIPPDSQKPMPPADQPVTPKETNPPELPAYSPPKVEAGEELHPINLPTALQLANVRAWDIAIAQQQLKLALARHQEAKVMWIPSLMSGVDYVPKQTVTNIPASTTVATSSSLAVGIAPYALLNITDAIFTPLSRRQDVRNQQAGVQTSTNDTLTAVAVAYFDAQEAQADLAAFETVLRLMDAVVRKTRTLAPGFVPEVELNRMLALQANLEQGQENARLQWRLASAELARVLRLPPTVVVQPLEPPNLRVTLVPPARTPEEMIPLALRLRPELTSYQSQIAAAEQRLKQERFRPFLPIVVVQGNSTSTPYPLGVNYFATNTGSSSAGNSASYGFDNTWDLKALWELKNFGFGNRALVRQRETSVDLARDQEYRFQDVVAKEITQAWSILRAADKRTGQSERELKQAWISASKNLQVLGETNRVAGNINILVIRPQEVSAAMQALVQAYYNYYGSVADYNRAQFRLYRALGNPAQQLHDHLGLFAAEPEPK